MIGKRWLIVLTVLLDAVLVNAGMALAFLIRFKGALPAQNFAAYQNLWVLLPLSCWVSFISLAFMTVGEVILP